MFTFTQREAEEEAEEHAGGAEGDDRDAEFGGTGLAYAVGPDVAGGPGMQGRVGRVVFTIDLVGYAGV